MRSSHEAENHVLACIWTTSAIERERTLYPILLMYSSISGIANSLRRPPDARTASRVAALDCSLFKCSTASVYVLVDIARDLLKKELYSTKRGRSADSIGRRKDIEKTDRAKSGICSEASRESKLKCSSQLSDTLDVSRRSLS